MKKIIAVFDGYRTSKSTLAYAEEFAYTTDAHLVGIFMDEATFRHPHAPGAGEAKSKTAANSDKEKKEKIIRKFEESCNKAKIQFSVRRDKALNLMELKHESMFADLMIISEQEISARYKQKSPSRFIKELLTDVQCPVMIVPSVYKPVDKITLLYDGGPSSLYAIKMFSYLFGDYHEVPVEVFVVKDRTDWNLRLPDNTLMREFIKRHFPGASYKIVKGVAEEEIVGHLRNYRENEMVVLGAYRRSELSRWFKTSMADVLMKELDTPLFIAHNK